MKRMIFTAAVVVLAGCAAQQKAVVADEGAKPVAKAAPAPAPAAAPGAVDQKAIDLDAVLKGLVVHFGFDAADLTPESRSRLDALADALRANPKVAIRIAGNCDELGTVEYNLALGQRRADAVARYLVTLGVANARVDTVSYGEEKPVDPRATEDAYAANRRAELDKKAN